jgi:molybdenum cofactor cytidylyltransferase
MIAENHGTKVVYNNDYAKGEILSSLKVGLRALPDFCPAVLVMLADQPLIEVETLQHIIATWQVERPAALAPTYRGQRGHPVLFSRELWPELLALPDGSAPREVLARHRDRVHLLPVDTTSVITDLDTPEDYEQALHG